MPISRGNPLARSLAGSIGLCFLVLMLGACLLTLPYTLGSTNVSISHDGGAVEIIRVPRYVNGDTRAARLPPFWASPSKAHARQLNALVDDASVEGIARTFGTTPGQVRALDAGPAHEALRSHWPRFFLGTDALGRSMLIRCLAGGGISLSIGLAAACISVLIGTLYGAIAGYSGGRVGGIMMRIVDVLYGLPYILLVILLAVASDAILTEHITRQKERGAWMFVEATKVAEARGASTHKPDVAIMLEQDAELDAALRGKALALMPPRRVSTEAKMTFDIVILLVAIGGVSWLTMSRVIRGQVLSLKSQPFIEAARALGIPPWRIFARHLLPNLTGPIIVYATLTVPQAILQESFLSFLGIGVKTPLPSWGNLAADGLPELNPYESNWWLLLFPCVLLGSTLLALNFVGEGLREALDPKRRQR